MKKKDYSLYIGNNINFLTPIKQISIRNRSYLECKCECGNIKCIQACDVINNKTKSCGCYNIKSAKERGYKHKLSGHRLYKLYHDIKKRCLNKNSRSYKNYGGRGITCEWGSFESFYQDMINLYDDAVIKYKKPSIERIDVNGNYCKSNCIFIENKDQSKNRRYNYNIGGMTLKEYCNENNLKPSTVYSRYYRSKKQSWISHVSHIAH